MGTNTDEFVDLNDCECGQSAPPAFARSERDCPHCKTETAVHMFPCDGHIVKTNHCRKHGDVVPKPIAPPDNCRKETPPHQQAPRLCLATPGSVWDGEGP